MGFLPQVRHDLSVTPEPKNKLVINLFPPRSPALVPTILADDADNPSGQSTFVSHDGSLAFALTVPDHGNTDIYFSLRVPVSVSWGAVGLGSDDMKGALFLIVYMNERGDNVTFSPRIAYGNVEPHFFVDMEWDVLDGTGVFDDHMVFTARCTKSCRNWPSGKTSKGYIDVSSPSQRAIYAVGPREGYASDSPKAPLKMHDEYGTFTIDMKRTRGIADAPVLTEDSESEGTVSNSRKTGTSDGKATAHGVVMILCIIGLMPLGVVLLRFGGWVRWHALNQTIAMIGVLVGFALGIVTSFRYQRVGDFLSKLHGSTVALWISSSLAAHHSIPILSDSHL